MTFHLVEHTTAKVIPLCTCFVAITSVTLENQQLKACGDLNENCMMSRIGLPYAVVNS